MITQERVQYLLWYDSETGNLIWKNPTSKRVSIFDIAGHIDDDYITIRLDKILYPAHCIIWLYVTGTWPEDQIDHKDLNKQNNRWANLREATPSLNGANKNKYATNKSGFKGVSWSKRRQAWLAQITINYKTINLGCYETAEKASEVYQKAAKEHFGEFSNRALVKKAMS